MRQNIREFGFQEQERRIICRQSELVRLECYYSLTLIFHLSTLSKYSKKIWSLEISSPDKKMRISEICLPRITSCTIQPLTQSVLQQLNLAKYYMDHKSSKILTRPVFPLSDRYLVSNLELWETKHLINLPARLYLDLSVPKQTKWSAWWAHFYVSNSQLRKVLLLKPCVLFSKSVDVEDYSSITFFHIFEGFFVPLVWIAVILSHTNTKK